jgi:ribosomal-protein-alanine N-acetyltransferase
MSEEHVKQIEELERACFSAPWSEESLRAELSNPLALWLCAVSGETVLGYIGSEMVPDEADMMNLAVAGEARRQGIAQALLSGLLSELRKHGIVSLSLEVRESNLPARALYETNGFLQVGRRKNYYFNPREDALILRKEPLA